MGCAGSSVTTLRQILGHKYLEVANMVLREITLFPVQIKTMFLTFICIIMEE